MALSSSGTVQNTKTEKVTYKELTFTSTATALGRSYSIRFGNLVVAHLGFNLSNKVISGNDLVQLVDDAYLKETDNIAFLSLTGDIYVFKISGRNLQANSEIPQGTRFIVDIIAQVTT